MEAISSGAAGNSPSDYFNQVIGLIEDIVIGEQFQTLQHTFMEAHYEQFDAGTDENRLEYMQIFAEYTATMETHIVDGLRQRMAAGFEMQRFADELCSFKGQLDGEIFELLYSLTDFLTFKEMLLDYKAFKSGAFADIAAGIVVQSLGSSASDDDDLEAAGAMEMVE